ncbi:pentapeptide repeat-containing protein [Okeania sp. KiyG1]|uniref:pentapeptide repeat-containing protein n=1 Tax=Okeania sp. KiyG1 TaxID=2720165 RepID=UPI0019238429|nr:pentapeptide repeat-containing protein [Okeania sp. KiyG1]GGA23922.1 hypothetical protein CYANOKiyG1_39330 [Okeania sp. KiyG1]
MMRVHEILQEYDKGRRNFRGESLRGLSFKGKNLSGVDFSGADIRGTNFRWANLTGAKFCGAKAGLQKRWAVLLVAVSLLVSVLLGEASGFASLIASGMLQPAFIQKYPIALGVIVFVSLAAFFIFSIKQGYMPAIITVGLSLATAVAIAGIFYGTMAGIGTGSAAVAIFIVLVGALAVIITLTIFVATVMSGAFVAVVGVTVAAMATASTVDKKLEGSMLDALNAVDSWESRAIAGGVAVAAVLLGSYIGWQANSEDEKHSRVRKIAMAFAATGGTSFSDANLTDANFTEARLKSTDFRGANITRTCWRDTVKLDRIRPGETYLKDAKVRELVTTGEGQDKNFNRLDLRGINLKEANLQDASFIGTYLNRANLQNANLSRAKLVQTLLEGADLTRATLTGAYIEDWGISNTTKLIEINCDYIFLKLPTKLAPDPQRRPADPEKDFEPGEFAKLVQKIPNTVDLIFKDGIDWQAFLKTFEELRVESQTGELPVLQTIENKGDGAFVIRVKVPDQVDEAEYERKFWEKYKPKLKAKNQKIKLLNQQIEHYKNIIMEIVKIMAEQEKIKNEFNNPTFGGGFAGRDQKFGGGLAGRDQISGNQYNYSTNPETKRNLAEAAKEIQELLKQLEESNPTETTASQMAVVTQAIEIVENNPTLKQRVIGVLKSAGTEALKEAIDNPIANIFVAAIEGWIEP